MPPPLYARLVMPVEQFGLDGVTLNPGTSVQVLNRDSEKQMFEVQVGTQVGAVAKSQLEMIAVTVQESSPRVRKKLGCDSPNLSSRVPNSLAISTKPPKSASQSPQSTPGSPVSTKHFGLNSKGKHIALKPPRITQGNAIRSVPTMKKPFQKARVLTPIGPPDVVTTKIRKFGELSNAVPKNTTQDTGPPKPRPRPRPPVPSKKKKPEVVRLYTLASGAKSAENINYSVHADSSNPSPAYSKQCSSTDKPSRKANTRADSVLNTKVSVGVTGAASAPTLSQQASGNTSGYIHKSTVTQRSTGASTGGQGRSRFRPKDWNGTLRRTKNAEKTKNPDQEKRTRTGAGHADAVQGADTTGDSVRARKHGPHDTRPRAYRVEDFDMTETLARKVVVKDGNRYAFHRWHEHSVTVASPLLRFHKAKDTRRKHQFDVNISGYDVLPPGEYTKKPYTILLSSADRRHQFLLDMPNANSLSVWINALTYAVEFADVDGGPASRSANPEDRRQFKEDFDKWWRTRPTKQMLISMGIVKDEYFGCPVKTLIAREGTRVPTFVTQCIAALERDGMLDEEGLYRVPGNLSLIQKIRVKVDQGDPTLTFNNGPTSLDKREVHAIAGALKLYLRELPEPLTTFESFLCWKKILAIDDETSMIRELAQTVTRLPAANYHTLKAIVMHLGNVMARADVNKMTSHNLAIVFGPTLIRPAKETPLEAIENITPSTSIMEKMILHREHIFGSESMAESSARGET